MAGFVILSIWATAASAVLGGLETTSTRAGFKKDDLLTLLARYLNWLMGFLGLIFFLMMIYGGISWMVNSRTGKDKEIAKAKNVLTAAIAGLMIVIAAFAVTAFLGDSFLTAQ